MKLLDLVYNYKNFNTTLHYSLQDKRYWGELENIQDVVFYDGKTIAEAKENFKKIVDDYLIYKK